MLYKLVCLTDERTIITSDDLSEVERRKRIHYRRKGHVSHIYPIPSDVSITGRELIASDTYLPLQQNNEEEE